MEEEGDLGEAALWRIENFDESWFAREEWMGDVTASATRNMAKTIPFVFLEAYILKRWKIPAATSAAALLSGFSQLIFLERSRQVSCMCTLQRELFFFPFF